MVVLLFFPEAILSSNTLFMSMVIWSSVLVDANLLSLNFFAFVATTIAASVAVVTALADCKDKKWGCQIARHVIFICSASRWNLFSILCAPCVLVHCRSILLKLKLDTFGTLISELKLMSRSDAKESLLMLLVRTLLSNTSLLSFTIASVLSVVFSLWILLLVQLSPLMMMFWLAPLILIFSSLLLSSLLWWCFIFGYVYILDVFTDNMY